MAQIDFKFNSHSGESFTVVSFQATEGISQLYRYEIELKAPLARAIELDDILDESATFILKQNGNDTSVHGILASFDEMQTVQGYVFYKAVLVPELWKLSIYKTNEIYTTEKTVDNIIQTVLENAGFESGMDFNLELLDAGHFLQRDYVCQFGESDYDFISRLMENEGIFYYFDHSGDKEKIIFINDLHYVAMDEPDLIYETSSSKSNQQRQISSWTCRKQRLPENISVRDYNSNQPSNDIYDTMSVDTMGSGTEYLYGINIENNDEATYLTTLRAEELKCNKTRFYAESSVARLQSGFSFALDQHPNTKYNGQEYLLLEITHEGSHLDMAQLGESSEHQSTYHNSFVAIDSVSQYRPPINTPKPRFYGTMTAFVHAEAATMKAEIDEYGRYRVHLPFDRADGTLLSTDPDRKASTWIRMAQPYVGQEQGMYYPLAGGTEVLLTFINGDPDQPIISGAVPNASQPSLLSSETNFQRTITSQPAQTITGNTHKVSRNSARLATYSEPPLAQHPTGINPGSSTHNSLSAFATVEDSAVDPQTNPPTLKAVPTFINEVDTYNPLNTWSPSNSMIPPWEGFPPNTREPAAYDENLTKFKVYDQNLLARPMNPNDIKDDVDDGDISFSFFGFTWTFDADLLEIVSTDRGAGDTYVYANGRTFAYPQHERVYFIGTFHEDFHVKDDFLDSTKSWTGVKEQFNFPPPGEDYIAGTAGDTDTDNEVNPRGIRGVSEDKRWGDQMFFAWGRSFSWSGGKGAGGSFECVNYGNGTTEDLINSTGGRFSDIPEDDRKHWDMFKNSAASPSPDRPAGFVPNPYASRDYEKRFVDAKGSTEPDAGDALAAYTFVDGNTYSYQCGHDLDVNVGESDSWCYGDSRDYVFGHSCSWVNGDSRSDVLGSSTDMLAGNSNSLTIGQTNDVTVGLTTETFVGGKFVMELAGESGISVTAVKYLKNRQDEIAAKESKASLSKLEGSINHNMNLVKCAIKAVRHEIKAIDHNVTVTNVSITAVQINCLAAFIKLG